MSLQGLGAVTSVMGAIGSVANAAGSVVGAVAPIVQGVTGVAGNIVAARGIQQESEYNAKIAEAQSALAERSAFRAEQNAEIARNAALIESARLIKEGRATAGTQAAKTAHAGLEVGGSPYLAMIESVRLSHENAVIARWKGDIAATGFQDQAQQELMKAGVLKGQAELLRARGRMAVLTGYTGALGAGLRGYRSGLEIANLMPKSTPPRQLDYLAGTGTAGGGYVPIESPDYQVGY